MKNRDRHIIRINEYDLMMNIEKNTSMCPIRAVAGIERFERLERCYKYLKGNCGECVQSWLNEESK